MSKQNLYDRQFTTHTYGRQEDLWAFIPSTAYPKHVHKEVKAALENAKSCNPDFVLASVKLQEVKNPNTPHELARMETLLVPSAYKFGVLYSADGQVTESDMFCNGLQHLNITHLSQSMGVLNLTNFFYVLLQ